MTEADGTICMQRGWTSSSSSSSSLSSSSAIQLFDIIASDETRRVVGDGRCDNDECYEQHGENSQRHKSESEGHCDGCEEDKVKVTVDDYSCAGDPQCLKK